MTLGALWPLTFGSSVNDQRLEGLLTFNPRLFSSLMGGEKEHGAEGGGEQNQ